MKIGDKVCIGKCKQYKNRLNGFTGEITRTYKQLYGVVVDGVTNKSSSYGVFWLQKNQIWLLEDEKIESEVIPIMMNNCNFIKVSFLDDENSGVCKYLYASFDEVSVGDVVVVKTGHHGLQVAKVVSIQDNNFNVPKSDRTNREVVCKVDIAAYEERKKKRERMGELQKMMSEKTKELQVLALFEVLAEKDESMKLLLDEYKELAR